MWIYVVKCNLFLWSKLYFHHHNSSLQCHMIFRNHNNMLIYCSTNISDYYQCWKQLCCWILWKYSQYSMYHKKLWYILFFRILWWIESSKEQHLFEIENFCNIINVFTVTFDQFIKKLLKCYFSKHATSKSSNIQMPTFLIFWNGYGNCF